MQDYNDGMWNVIEIKFSNTPESRSFIRALMDEIDMVADDLAADDVLSAVRSLLEKGW
jgi:hypothetical protein